MERGAEKKRCRWLAPSVLIQISLPPVRIKIDRFFCSSSAFSGQSPLLGCDSRGIHVFQKNPRSKEAKAFYEQFYSRMISIYFHHWELQGKEKGLSFQSISIDSLMEGVIITVNRGKPSFAQHRFLSTRALGGCSDLTCAWGTLVTSQSGQLVRSNGERWSLGHLWEDICKGSHPCDTSL